MKIEGHGYSQYVKRLKKGEIGKGDILYITTLRTLEDFVINANGELVPLDEKERERKLPTERVLAGMNWYVEKDEKE